MPLVITGESSGVHLHAMLLSNTSLWHMVQDLSELEPSVQTLNEVFLWEQKALIPLSLWLLCGSVTVVRGEEGEVWF